MEEGTCAIPVNLFRCIEGVPCESTPNWPDGIRPTRLGAGPPHPCLPLPPPIDSHVMAKKEDARLINPFLVVGALIVIAIGLGAGLWLALKESPQEQRALPVEVVEKPEKQVRPPKEAQSAPEVARAPVPEETREATAEVRGVVYLGAEDTRAAGVTVRAFPQGKVAPAHEVRTDDLGQFQIPDLQPGNWLFRAGGEGLAEVHAKSYDNGREIKPGESQADVALRVVPSATLEGKVLNAIGKELPGATVQVIRGANSAGEEVQGPPLPPFPRIGLFESPPPPSKARTVAKGEFALAGLEAGTYDLVAYASGYARQMIREARTGTSDTIFRLEPEVRLFGTVKLSSTGAILPGATISVQVPLKEGPFLSGNLLAGPTGTYEIRNLPRRFEALLKATIDRADSCNYRLAPIGGLSQIRQDLLIMDNRKITGHVVHAFDRSPLAEVEVALKNRAGERSIVRTGADGGFVVETSFSNNELLFRKPGGFEDNQASASFTDDSAELDIGEIELVQGVRVSGRVIDAKSKGGGRGSAGPGLPRRSDRAGLGKTSLPNHLRCGGFHFRLHSPRGLLHRRSSLWLSRGVLRGTEGGHRGAAPADPNPPRPESPGPSDRAHGILPRRAFRSGGRHHRKPHRRGASDPQFHRESQGREDPFGGHGPIRGV